MPVERAAVNSTSDARAAGLAVAPDPMAGIHAALEHHRGAHALRASWQLVNTLVPYLAVWIAMPFALAWSVWAFLPLALLAAGLLVRLFILFHDCTHNSFFASRRANMWWGRVLGTISFTCFEVWRAEHTQHHATSGDLDRRGTGDIWTLTVDEYKQAAPFKRLCYRLSRQPLLLFGVAPVLMLVFWQHWPKKDARPNERRALAWQNALLIAFVIALSWWLGPWQYLVMQGTVLALAGAAGVWLFYVQHQFPGVYWGRGANWDYDAAALKGSSYYKLPALLRWFSANIGFHHVHHLDARIPNYNLARCQREIEPLVQVPELSLWGSRRALNLALWDERAGELVTFAQAAARA